MDDANVGVEIVTAYLFVNTTKEKIYAGYAWVVRSVNTIK